MLPCLRPFSKLLREMLLRRVQLENLNHASVSCVFMSLSSFSTAFSLRGMRRDIFLFHKIILLLHNNDQKTPSMQSRYYHFLEDLFWCSSPSSQKRALNPFPLYRYQVQNTLCSPNYYHMYGSYGQASAFPLIQNNVTALQFPTNWT